MFKFWLSLLYSWPGQFKNWSNLFKPVPKLVKPVQSSIDFIQHPLLNVKQVGLAQVKLGSHLLYTKEKDQL